MRAAFVKVITGPTGSGKTDLALNLLNGPDGKVFNADGFQFYREIPILGNQPSSQLERFQFLADRSLLSPMNAGEFGRLAAPLLDEPGIWVGTGLYLGAALYGLSEEKIRGTPFQGEPRRPYRMLVLDPPRDYLYQRLNLRVDQMLDRGALEEARRIKEAIDRAEISRSNVILKAIGLKHLLGFLNDEMSLASAIELWKRDTRRLAKRQWTWLRKFCAPAAHCLWVKNLEGNQDLAKFLNE